MQEDVLDFDAAVVMRLKMVLAAKFPVLLDSFTMSMQRSLEQLDACVQAGDAEQVRALAHKLVSTAGQFGLLKLSALAKGLEHAQESDLPSLAPTVAAMKAEYARHADALAAMR